jgi:hypothetical protein
VRWSAGTTSGSSERGEVLAEDEGPRQRAHVRVEQGKWNKQDGYEDDGCDVVKAPF